MRGKIIQYNGADGTGIIVCDGRHHRFELSLWRGDHAPAVNRTVELTWQGEELSAVVPVGEDVLLKEKAAALGGKLGSLFNRPAAPAAASGGAISGKASDAGPAATHGAVTAQAILARYGKPLLAVYALFLFGSMAFDAVSVSLGPGIGRSLFDAASLMSQMGASGGGTIKMLLLLGYASIALPALWRDRRAWLALLVPLLGVLWAVFSTIHLIGSVGRGMGQGMSDFVSIGFGFYLSLLAAVVLAVFAVKRFLASA